MSELTRLLDREAISQTLTRGARLLDDRDWTLLPEIFADDVVFDYGDGTRRQGIMALRTLLIGFLQNCGPTQHLMGNLLVEMQGDSASSRIYCRARHQGLGDRGDLFFDAHGEYQDRWERRPEGWRIVERVVASSLVRGDIAALGMAPA